MELSGCHMLFMWWTARAPVWTRGKLTACISSEAASSEGCIARPNTSVPVSTEALLRGWKCSAPSWAVFNSWCPFERRHWARIKNRQLLAFSKTLSGHRPSVLKAGKYIICRCWISATPSFQSALQCSIQPWKTLRDFKNALFIGMFR